MLFNSFIFIFLFLPLTLIGWYGLNKIHRYKPAQIFLVAMSLWFYAYFNVSYLPIILVSCFINYFFSYLIAKGISAKAVCTAGCVVNLGILGYFKYYDFFVENINAVLGMNFNLKHILLPLGISFFTFQQLSFVIDRCTGRAPHYGFLEYMNFVTFFPQLIAGPIVLHSELVPQFKDESKKSFDTDSFAQGIAFFVFGLSKKVLLADSLIRPVEYAFTHVTGLDTPSAILGILAYTFELYFDFSGYCDMAVGIGKMFRIEIPDNFDSPYKSASVKELWRRWHITLGRFFTTYVYFPLGGNRKGTVRTVINTMTVFLLSGLWHGANWTFVIWGALQGIAISFETLRDKLRKDGKTDKKQIKRGFMYRVSQLLTFCYFALSVIFFRSDSVDLAITYFKQMFSFCYSGRMFIMTDTLKCPELYMVTKLISLKAPQLVSVANFIIFMLIMLICVIALAGRRTRVIVENAKWGIGFGFVLAFLFVWSVIALSGVSTFLYFNF